MRDCSRVEWHGPAHHRLRRGGSGLPTTGQTAQAITITNTNHPQHEPHATHSHTIPYTDATLRWDSASRRNAGEHSAMHPHQMDKVQMFKGDVVHRVRGTALDIAQKYAPIPCPSMVTQTLL